MTTSASIAYFSMEIALVPSIPTYSGGLGVLAGDTLRAAADLAAPMVGITLVHRKGYFHQHLDDQGNQSETPILWHPEELLQSMSPVVSVDIEGREVKLRAWRYVVEGIGGHKVPVYLLDTCLPENSPSDRGLTDSLYGGDAHYRLCQEVVLGMGGIAILPRLGHSDISTYHMNEGHSALLTLALLEQRLDGRSFSSATEEDVNAVRSKCVFTTHTPVPAGQDQFPRNLVSKVLGERRVAALETTGASHEGSLNMTSLALFGAHYVNGVAMQHGEVSRSMFPSYPIRAITNGVHAVTWTAPAFRALYDQRIPEWRRDNVYLRYAIGIDASEVRAAHVKTKAELIHAVKERNGALLDENVFTIGFARRAATYKRGDLLFSNPERLRWIVNHVGPVQVIFGGKAHPNDRGGKDLIRRIFECASALKDAVKVVYIEDYDWEFAPLLCAGTDLWLNTPRRPQEASGTSGMKAALNGVPSFSVMDGWWVEGCLEGITGWAIGHGPESPEDEALEVGSMYDKLETIIMPRFYGRPRSYAKVMRSAIAINGSFFNTQRMLSQYLASPYFRQAAA